MWWLFKERDSLLLTQLEIGFGGEKKDSYKILSKIDKFILGRSLLFFCDLVLTIYEINYFF